MIFPNPSISFSLPLSINAHDQAEQFRRHQSNPRKAKQVYLNTLAVYAVHQYLEWLGIATDLAASDSQDLVQASLTNVADLMVHNLGKLDCCPVLPGETVVSMMSPTSEDRIGCVAVELDADLRRATLLGFVKTWTTETVPCQDLCSLPEFLEYLESLCQRVDLRLWFQNVATSSWKSIEQVLDQASEVLNPSTPALAYRSTPSATSTALPNTIPALIDLFHTHSDKWTRVQILSLLSCIAEGDGSAISFLTQVIDSTADDELRRQAAVSLGIIQPDHNQAGVRRAKVVELGLQLDHQRLLLVLTLTPDGEGDIEVHLRLYPMANAILPANLHLSILDEWGNPVLEEQTLGDEDWTQLMFHGSRGDRFSLQVKWGETSFNEAFVI